MLSLNLSCVQIPLDSVVHYGTHGWPGVKLLQRSFPKGAQSSASGSRAKLEATAVRRRPPSFGRPTTANSSDCPGATLDPAPSDPGSSDSCISRPRCQPPFCRPLSVFATLDPYRAFLSHFACWAKPGKAEGRWVRWCGQLFGWPPYWLAYPNPICSPRGFGFELSGSCSSRTGFKASSFISFALLETTSLGRGRASRGGSLHIPPHTHGPAQNLFAPPSLPVRCFDRSRSVRTITKRRLLKRCQRPAISLRKLP